MKMSSYYDLNYNARAYVLYRKTLLVISICFEILVFDQL